MLLCISNRVLSELAGVPLAPTNVAPADAIPHAITIFQRMLRAYTQMYRATTALKDEVSRLRDTVSLVSMVTQRLAPGGVYAQQVRADPHPHARTPFPLPLVSAFANDTKRCLASSPPVLSTHSSTPAIRTWASVAAVGFTASDHPLAAALVCHPALAMGAAAILLSLWNGLTRAASASDPRVSVQAGPPRLPSARPPTPPASSDPNALAAAAMLTAIRDSPHFTAAPPAATALFQQLPRGAAAAGATLSGGGLSGAMDPLSTEAYRAAGRVAQQSQPAVCTTPQQQVRHNTHCQSTIMLKEHGYAKVYTHMHAARQGRGARSCPAWCYE